MTLTGNTHGAAVMTGLYFGVAERIEEVANVILQVRPCMIFKQRYCS
jgi:hypothetical protein